jgi:hypothetical protein
MGMGGKCHASAALTHCVGGRVDPRAGLGRCENFAPQVKPITIRCIMSLQHLWERPQQLLRVGSRAARGKIVVNCISNRLNYCLIFILHK